jgi:hypothetical protein
MNFKTLVAGSVCSVALLFSGLAQADVIQWNLSGVTFDDGGIAIGTFSTDSTNGQLLSYDLTTTAGTVQGGFHYTAATSTIYGNNVFNPNSFLITRTSPFAQPYLNLSFVNSLDHVGTNTLKTGGPVTGSWECTNCGAVRGVTGGFAQAVPEPETYAMMMAGLGLLAFVARRRKQA